jgi:hypothetical protein
LADVSKCSNLSIIESNFRAVSRNGDTLATLRKDRDVRSDFDRRQRSFPGLGLEYRRVQGVRADNHPRVRNVWDATTKCRQQQIFASAIALRRANRPREWMGMSEDNRKTFAPRSLHRGGNDIWREFNRNFGAQQVVTRGDIHRSTDDQAPSTGRRPNRPGEEKMSSLQRYVSEQRLTQLIDAARWKYENVTRHYRTSASRRWMTRR